MASPCALYERSPFKIQHPDAAGFYSWDWVLGEQVRCRDAMHDARLPLAWTSDRARAALVVCLAVRQLALWSLWRDPLVD